MAIRFCAAKTAEGRVYLGGRAGEVAHQWQPVRAGDAVLLPNGNLGYNGSHRTSANLLSGDLGTAATLMATPDNEIVRHYEDISTITMMPKAMVGER